MHTWLRLSAGLAVGGLLWTGTALGQARPACDQQGKVNTPERVGGDATKVDMAQGRVTVRESDGTLHEFQASKELRAGTNGWMCMLDLAGDSMCLDKEWQAWGDAWMNKKEPPKPKTVGVAYMLKGDKGASNTDPYATKPTADNQWVVSGPHIMLLPTDVSQLDAYPTDWTKGGPWVMWKGTPYAHIMVPTTSMAKSASKAPAEKKPADKK